MSLELLRAEQTSYAELSRKLGAEVAPDWPPEHWEPHVFGFIERQYAEDPKTLGWNRYVLLRRQGQQPILMGTVGGFRKSEQEAEIGYSVVPSFKRLVTPVKRRLRSSSGSFLSKACKRSQPRPSPH